MNNAEKRRKQLLNQTRGLYSDNKTWPAVHPRYGAVYSQLYGNDDEGVQSTFGVRMVLCILLFAMFMAMNYKDVKIANVDSRKITNAIEQQVDLQEVWKNL